MTELNDRIAVTANISDTVFSIPSFSTVGILAKHAVSGLSRVESYSSLSAVTAVFGSYSPVGVAASLFFSQPRTPDKLFVIERGSSESVSDALDAAAAFNGDFFFVVSAERDNTSIKAVEDWAFANNRIPFFSSADSTALTATETDPFFYGNDLSYHAAGYFLKNAGSDIVATAITVASTTATVASVAHGAAVGDIAYVWSSAVSALIGKWEITVVPDVDSFEFVVPAGTASDSSGGIKILINGQFIEMGILGKMAGTEPGRYTFDLQNISGVSADKLTDTEKGFLAGKNANYYTDISGTSLTSGLKSNGYGGKLLSGRNIDLHWFVEWFKANIQVDIISTLANAGGEMGFDVDDLQKIQTKLEERCQTAFNNKAITTFPSGDFAGRDYVVQMPLVSEISSVDRLNGLLKGIKIYMFYRGKIKGVEIEVNLAS